VDSSSSGRHVPGRRAAGAYLDEAYRPGTDSLSKEKE
jgi:hypothetical protein